MRSQIFYYRLHEACRLLLSLLGLFSWNNMSCNSSISSKPMFKSFCLAGITKLSEYAVEELGTVFFLHPSPAKLSWARLLSEYSMCLLLTTPPRPLFMSFRWPVVVTAYDFTELYTCLQTIYFSVPISEIKSLKTAVRPSYEQTWL